MTTRLFVYGTLMPGHMRWGLLAPFAVEQAPDRVPGQLYDTGCGWPGARFLEPLDVPVLHDGRPEPATDIIGWTVDLDPAAVDAILEELDIIEGVAATSDGPDGPAGHYRRVLVATASGVIAWSYEATGIGADWTPIPEWTDQDES